MQSNFSELQIQVPDFVSSDKTLHSWELFLKHGVSFKRLYMIEVRRGQMRGKHAHKTLVQFFLVLKGRVLLTLEAIDGSKQIIRLEDSEGLLIPRNVWREFCCESVNAQILVAADQPYKESDYIRSYSEFRNQKI